MGLVVKTWRRIIRSRNSFCLLFVGFTVGCFVSSNVTSLLSRDNIQDTREVKKTNGSQFEPRRPTMLSKQLPRSRETEKYNTDKGSPPCPQVPPHLVGRLLYADTVETLQNMSMADVEIENVNVQQGGVYRPTECAARHSILVVLPFRDRMSHLIQFLGHMLPVLQRQQVQLRIIVSEQFGRERFNKGIVMNTAVKTAMTNNWTFDCVILHDLDLILQDDRNIYRCFNAPLHMSKIIKKTQGTYNFYPQLVGGVLNLRKEHYIRINGYSNLFWGWGGEDDDMYKRIRAVKLKLRRPPDKYAKYKALEHISRKGKEPRMNERMILLGAQDLFDRRKIDGFSTLTSKVLRITEEPLYTHLLVDVGKKPNNL